MRYDPLTAPEPESWLDLDEGEQLESILRYHKRAKLRCGNVRLHALIHVIVENQLAEGLLSASSALGRLQGQGLDRHDAIHAIGSVLASGIYNAMRGEEFRVENYETALDSLSADSWRRTVQEE